MNGSETSSTGGNNRLVGIRPSRYGTGEDRSPKQDKKKPHLASVPAKPSRVGDAFVPKV